MTGTRAKRDYLFTLCLDESNFTLKSIFLNQRVGCFRLGSLTSNDFANSALKDGRLLIAVFESATGAANQANIGIDALKEIFFPLPPLPEQHRIVQKLEQILQVCDTLQASIQESRGYNEQLLKQVLREALKGE